MSKRGSYSLQAKNGLFYVVISYKNDHGAWKQAWRKTGIATQSGNKREAAKAEREARKAAGAIFADWQKEFAHPEKDLLFACWSKSWLQAKRGGIQLSTAEGYAHYLKDFIFPAIGDKKFIAISEQTCTDFFQSIANLGGTTRLHVYRLLKQIFDSAVEQGIITESPLKNIPAPRAEKYLGDWYTPSEAQKLLSVTKNETIYPAIFLGCYLGLRRSEVLGLKWGAINFSKNIISIESKVIFYRDVNGKTKFAESSTMKSATSKRDLPMTDTVRGYLMKLYAEREATKNDFICIDEHGNLISSNRLTKRFHAVLKKYELRPIRFHDLRHTCATLMLKSGSSMKQVQVFLGHSSFSTTSDIYSHVDFIGKIEAAEGYEKLISLDKEKESNH